ncbi:MAG: serine/threonine protein kinase [Pseudomonadales bacterium]|nr:serine/threonine protein kinase [Pseudomonadales bacterium]
MVGSDSERQARALELFFRALEEPAADRKAWIVRNTADNLPLQEAVLRLHAADTEATDAAPLTLMNFAEPDLTGSRIGQWKIVDTIASGGMGRVYLAERTGADFQQRGALKILRIRALDNPAIRDELLRRFNNERQILAHIQHPNIASIVDGGTTDDGLPYLVMEYVSGLSLTEYLQAHPIGLQARLRLFRELLDAVGAAHRSLVVHRDIKPSNIMVDAEGHLKLLDFGIAKVLEPRDGMASTDTATATQAMTPDFASPEQLLGRPITVASDIYSLGLLLYRLLAGVAAYTVSNRSPVEAHALVCLRDPPLPSKSATEGHDPAVPGWRLKGDLDAIVMKAIRKEPQERYGSTVEFAADIERFLGGLPVLAQRNSARYRAKKFIRRNWLAVTSTTTIILTLTAGLAVSLWQYANAEAATRRAEDEKDKANAVVEFLQEVLSQADPLETGTNPTIREALDQAESKLGDRFDDHPEIEAAVRHTLGWTQMSLGHTDLAVDNLYKAYQLNEAHYGPTHEDTLRSLSALGWMSFDRLDFDKSREYYKMAIERFSEDVPKVLRATILNDYAVTLDGAGESAAAIAPFEEAVRLYRQSNPSEPGYDLGSALSNLGVAYQGIGNFERAEQLFKQHIAMAESGEDDSKYAFFSVLNNYSLLLRDTGRLDEALVQLRRSVRMRYELLGPEHPSSILAGNNLTMLLLQMHRLDEARANHLSVAPAAAGLGITHRHALRVRLTGSMLENELGNRSSAITDAQAILVDLQPMAEGEYQEIRAQVCMHLGEMLSQDGQHERALVLMQEAIAQRTAYYGANHRNTEQARQRANVVRAAAQAPAT